MKKIKFAVIGCGHIGKKHAEVISKNTAAELVALIDIKNSKELKLDTFHVPFFSSLKDFFVADVDVDVINIATPNGLHAVQAIECLNAHKHVVIEKPVTLHAADAKKIIELSQQKQKHVFVVMQNRYSPPIIWLREIIEKNVLGKIFSVQLNCFWNRDDRYYTKDNWRGKKDLDGGTLFTQFSHFIDIFYWLFGDIKNIQTKLRSFNHQQLTEFEDSGMVTFDFGDNSIGCLNFSTAVYDKNMESSITIIAENGSIKIGGQYMDKLEYCHIKNYTTPHLPGSNEANNYGSYSGSAANHYYIIKNVIDVLNHKAPIATSAKEGMKVVEIIERIYQSAK